MEAIVVSCRDRAYAEAHFLPVLRQAGWAGGVDWRVPGEGGGLDQAAALLLSGGLDIHPRHWDPDEPVHPLAEPDPERDAAELPLVRDAWSRNLPILGICRGAQILNVSLGGSLIQDIPDHFGCPADRHRHGTALEPGALHPVEIVAGSRLARILGAGPVAVNSRHHQAVLRAAPGLRTAAFDGATCRDGAALVEGIEAAEPGRWVLGVQWHPEDLTLRRDPAGEAARRLFRAFVDRLDPAGGPPAAPLSSMNG